MKMRYPILIIGGLCCSALGFPLLAFPPARRRSDSRYDALSHSQLLRLDCPLILRRCRCRSPDRRAASHHGLAGVVFVLGPQSDRPQIAAPLAPFCRQKRRAGQRCRGGSSPGHSRRNPQTFLAHYPGARTLHRSVHFRRRGVRQDLGLHAPIRRANLVPAGRQSLATGWPTSAIGGASNHSRTRGRFSWFYPSGSLVFCAERFGDRSVPNMGDHQPALSRLLSR